MAIPLTVGRSPTAPPNPYASGQGYGSFMPPHPSVTAGPRPPSLGIAPPPGGYGATWLSAGGAAQPSAPEPPPPAAGVNVQAPGYGTPGGGSSVDWASMIGGSYEVAQAEALMGAQVARAKASLQNALRSNLIDLGAGAGTDLGDLSKYIDKTTLQNAINNKYSVYSQVADQTAKANATNAAQLAARGMLSSGQTTTDTQNVTNQAEQARYQGLREFLRSGQTGIEHLGDVKSQLAQGVMQARFAAAARLAQQYATANAGGGSYLGSAPSAPAPAAPEPAPAPDWANTPPYTPYQGGWLVPAGPDASGAQQPYFVSPGSGAGNLGWMSNYPWS